jgi:anti-sigma factor RsiW
MTHDPSHGAVDELLAWYANGTLSGDERASVERHVAGCVACQQELGVLREVAEAATALAAAVPAIPEALGTAFARIDEWERSKVPSGMERLVAFFRSLASPPALPRWVFVAQFALILLLGGLLLVPRSPEPAYTTLSGGDGPAGGTRLTVIFQPAATAEAIRQTLRAVGGNVVAGPSAAGVYVVELATPVEKAADVETVIDTLRGSTAVITFVERQP